MIIIGDHCSWSLLIIFVDDHRWSRWWSLLIFVDDLCLLKITVDRWLLLIIADDYCWWLLRIIVDDRYWWSLLILVVFGDRFRWSCRWPLLMIVVDDRWSLLLLWNVILTPHQYTFAEEQNINSRFWLLSDSSMLLLALLESLWCYISSQCQFPI